MFSNLLPITPKGYLSLCLVNKPNGILSNQHVQSAMSISCCMSGWAIPALCVPFHVASYTWDFWSEILHFLFPPRLTSEILLSVARIGPAGFLWTESKRVPDTDRENTAFEVIWLSMLADESQHLWYPFFHRDILIWLKLAPIHIPFLDASFNLCIKYVIITCINMPLIQRWRARQSLAL